MQVIEDMDALKAFIIEYHNEYGYDTTNDWNYSWTFSKALLFTVTIITTIGKILRVTFCCTLSKRKQSAFQVNAFHRINKIKFL